MKIEGTIAIVTGGASGLGAATARLLAAKGARVAIFDVNRPAAEKLAKELGGLAFACDVANALAAEEAVAGTKSELGVPRILVNCAGIGPSARIVSKAGPMPLADFETAIRVNLVGSFNLMRLAAAEMIAAEPLDTGERGVSISTASVAAYEGQIGQAAYAASKGGIVSLTLPAAREFAQFGIRVNTIAPGLFETPLLKGLPEEARASIGAAIPFPKRMGQAQEYAALAAHIVENSYINGEVIRIDGALRMGSK